MTKQAPRDQSLVDELSAFKAGLRLNKAGDTLRRQRWMVGAGELPFEDFNREVIPPGTLKRYPRGAVGIRIDGDFWTAAVLPYRFVGLDCAAIVATLWPEIESPTIFPDSGDPWWAATQDESAEVPGEPFETWSRITYPSGDDERCRDGTHADMETAKAHEAGMRWHMTAGSEVMMEIHRWQDGSRTKVEEFPATHVDFSEPDANEPPTAP